MKPITITALFLVFIMNNSNAALFVPGNFNPGNDSIFPDFDVIYNTGLSRIQINDSKRLLSNSITIYSGNKWNNFADSYGIHSIPYEFDPSYYPMHSAYGIGAKFSPNGGYSLDQAAKLLGFDHFNWLQIVTTTSPTSSVFIDPPGPLHSNIIAEAICHRS